MLLAAGLLTLLPAASATPGTGLRGDQGGEAYRERVDKDLMAYGEIKKIAERTFDARVVNQRLEAEPRDGPPRYHLRLIRRDGTVIDVILHAKTGEILTVKGSD
ncbi:hypothetical protein CKO24_09050 [Rhodothalassium salexigens DSM 2132]|nr:hypothetical protein [Rhodothalassium salexigens DSM 2132]